MRLAVRSWLLSALVFAASCQLPAVSMAAAWREEKGEHFIVYYATNEAFAKQVRFEADRSYQRIAREIGFERSGDYWQWENRARIFIYPTEAAFHAATGQPKWSKGVAQYQEKAIATFAGAEGFLNAILPHEMTHLIFRDFIGFKSDVPLWIDEGVAQWQEPAKRALAQQVARYLIEQKKALPLRRLTGMDVRGSNDTEFVHHFYMQSVSVIDCLMRAQGPRSFAEFCRALRDGKSVDRALKSAYPGSLSDLDKLEKAWTQYALSN